MYISDVKVRPSNCSGMSPKRTTELWVQLVKLWAKDNDADWELEMDQESPTSSAAVPSPSPPRPFRLLIWGNALAK